MARERVHRESGASLQKSRRIRFVPAARSRKASSAVLPKKRKKRKRKTSDKNESKRRRRRRTLGLPYRERVAILHRHAGCIYSRDYVCMEGPNEGLKNAIIAKAKKKKKK